MNKAKKLYLLLSQIGLSTLFLPLISSSCKLEKSQPSEYKVKYENRMLEINNNLHQFENNSNSMINVEIWKLQNTMNSMSQDLENLLKTNSENESYELLLDKLNIEYDKFIKTIEKIKNQNTQPETEDPGAETEEPETPAPQPETPAPQPDTPETGTEDQTAQQNEETKIKWGHWNILNFTGDRHKQYKKTKRIALLANEEKFDVLGLTEVDKEEGVKTLVDELNQLNSSNFYSYVISKKLKGEKFGKFAVEHIAVIYNNQKMEAEAFDNKGIGYSYTQKFTDEFGDTNAQYSRPPYGVKFKYKLKPETKLTFVFAHFDGPGVSKSNEKIGEQSYRGLGSFEYREAKQLANVLDYFDSIDGEQSNIFFGGDTNIKLRKQDLAFSTMENKYKSVFSDIEEHNTSLAKRKNNYSQPYDKMFYKTNYQLVSFEKFDLYKVKTDEKVKALLKKHNVGLEAKEKASTISDHTYISAEFLIK
ncbi:nuclease [Mycoplasmopsis arginini]|uniref:endonuclease/exonuclease/phosphatase family protein n=1 Tax=Mycoplasmopsis arginini TaxID=2094 RepID=UPI000D60D207|nr:endonuclease/exonuclease/phosphatase family protein [Mycoplasmopsis arginini]PWC08895.1 nuclease [Mycoplasmopsis arginini]